ncbi:Flagellar hook-length control protein FliK [Photobacterium marinum]|uniref:Flagellar hook-length control protein FliK n=1 Tax=Photobacterium marinum TaxID=1056511 RepID=L8JI14_9GAMM|nr:flagellar hook-length control protein FliK [Photobacterium marinum]ELR67087.1 Flagellar hook-length control protein FliK [Photobacterium marinum]
MQVTANVAVKNVAKTATSADMPSVKTNGSNGEKPMSFAEFEQRLDQKPEADKGLPHAEKTSPDAEVQPALVAGMQQPLPAEELALQIEQLLAQAVKPEGANLPAEAEAEVSAEMLQVAMTGQTLQSTGVTEPGKVAVLEQLQTLVKPQGMPVAVPKEPQALVHEALLAARESLPQVKASAIPNEMLANNKELMAAIDPSVIEKLTTTSLATPTLHVHSAMSSNINMLTQAAQASAQSASAASAQAQQLQASVDITQPEWGRDLVDQLRSRMQLSKTDQIQHAHVRLDPPELGRLEINLRLEGDKVSVHFTAAHPQLREALAANADRLRFDFDGSQMQLADVSVSSGMYQQSRQHSGSDDEPAVITNNVTAAKQEAASTSAQELDGRYESMV